MNFGSSQHPDPEDLFSDTRMSFGDHIEELRTHLWKAIGGFLIAVVFSFFIGRQVMEFIARPVVHELQVYWDRYYAKKHREIIEGLQNGSISGGQAFRTTVKLEINGLKQALGLQEKTPRRAFNITPVVADLMKDLGVQDPLDNAQIEGGKQWVEVPTEFVSPVILASQLQQYQTLVGKRPTLSTLNVQEGFVVFIQVCLVTGFVLASPWVFYQIWSFVAAGLYPHEKRYVNVFLPVSIGLFLAGVLLSEFFVIPQAVHALLWFNEWLNLEPDLRLNEWLSFAILVPLVFGISFQTPLVMLFLERIGLVTVEKFRGMRRIAWFVLCVFAAIIIPTFDIPTMLMLWLPMCLLYELGIWMCAMAPQRPTFDDEDSPKSDELIEV
jgi:sec-independent protein translocase protein TatC